MPRRKQAKSKEPEFPLNWQRKARGADKMSPYKFDKASVSEDGLALTLADNTTLCSGDYCYVVNNAGEPFAIGRIMEFVRGGGGGGASSSGGSTGTPSIEQLYSVHLNWLYRPGSIHKKAQNSRELLLTMHSDTVPLDSLRPKVTVVNRHEIEDLEVFIEKPSHFWFDRYWDRYISRFYDAVPATQITNIPPELGPIIRSRFMYLILEPQRTKLLTEAPQFCAVCDLWCSETDSVHCVDCDDFFHRGCTNPPIANPLRGYSWSCGPCTLAHEQQLEQQRGPDLTMRRKRSPMTAEKRQLKEQKEAEYVAQQEELEKQLEQEYLMLRKELVPECKEIEKAVAQYNQELTPAQVRSRKMWPFRYLGVNSSIKDVFDLDDRIYPRAISRVGAKHQANVPEWPGRPVVYYRTIVPDRSRKRGPRRKAVAKDQIKYEPDDLDHSLPWVQKAPEGYIERGSSMTSALVWTPDSSNTSARNSSAGGNAEKFLEKCRNYADSIGIHHTCPNFIDACLYEFMNASSESGALTSVGMFTKKLLKEPDFTDSEVEKFEKAVAVHGNNLHQVFKMVKTKSAAEIVRFYYLWKKSEGGRRVWDNCQARVSRHREASQNEEFMEKIRDDSDPVLGFSLDALKELGKPVKCKFCTTSTSREWRVAPHVVIGPLSKSIEALCSRCSRIWYRYAVEWMDPELVVEFNANKLTKFRVEPELLEDAQSILNERKKFFSKHQQSQGQQSQGQQGQQSPDTSVTTPQKRRVGASGSPSKRRKRVKAEDDSEASADNDDDDDDDDEIDDLKLKEESGAVSASNSDSDTEPKAEDSNEGADELPSGQVDPGGLIDPPVEPESVEVDEDLELEEEEEDLEEDLEDLDDDDDDVDGFHRSSRSKEAAYSYTPNYCAVCSQYDPSFAQLTCQICSLSVHAKCYGFVDEPDSSIPWHCDCCLNDKDNFADHIYQCDLCPVRLPNYAAWLTGEQTGAPDALKCTWDGKWSHVRCAVWSPGVLFENSEWLQQVELYPYHKDECTICLAQGLCTDCYICKAKLHAGCAGASGLEMGIVFTPSESGPVMWGNQRGSMVAAIICSAHGDSAAAETDLDLIPMSEIDAATELTALQTYARHYKQAPQPELEGYLRRSLLHPGSAAEGVLVIPVSFIEDNETGDPLRFFHPDTNICAGCETTQSAYWIRYPDGFTRCCHCYWETKEPEQGHGAIDAETVTRNMKKLFDPSARVPKQAAPRSMRIQDILS